jgi:energy-coupling factor transporter transmembrane protein EcfT
MQGLMNKNSPKQITIFFILCIIAAIGIVISSVILMNTNGMDQRLQGWVNLLWLPLIALFFIIDRVLVKKFPPRKVNKIQLYIVVGLVLLFLINWGRLQLQY